MFGSVCPSVRLSGPLSVLLMAAYENPDHEEY